MSDLESFTAVNWVEA